MRYGDRMSTQKNASHHVNWMIHQQKSHWNIVGLRECRTEQNKTQIVFEEMWVFLIYGLHFFSATQKTTTNGRIYSHFYWLCVIFHVKSYTFQYLFMHESFVYFAFDYDPTLRFSRIDAHLRSFTHGSSVAAEEKKIISVGGLFQQITIEQTNGAPSSFTVSMPAYQLPNPKLITSFNGFNVPNAPFLCFFLFFFLKSVSSFSTIVFSSFFQKF